ncbi:hypothetical protein A9Q84_08915 [Halobacteriovorax marinus]|uniref:Endonuclease/exonuclease/phosphatase domain-containing protein n=1 Tax=Halobacteriovorax marinus TaxID=97084 RepID=A0A1Y5FC86_9BACT|nr:hypothetical protein A9Q84_08915 [Halobacteriovorax marinus]
MKYTLLLLLILLSSCALTPKKLNPEKSFLKIVHYNIKELNTVKLNSESKQLASVRAILNRFDSDILSINEIQYDLPNIPNDNFQTEGKNLDTLALKLGRKDISSVLRPANTGKNARKRKNGTYHSNFSAKNSRKFADPVNFGIFPAQYSTGALISNKLKILNVKTINELKWKQFNPKAKITRFTDASGKKLTNKMELFDKNFTDILVEKDSIKFHIILLHTVPAFHFGNKKSPNYERNADQLRFLEWYLTGSTNIKVGKTNITPLTSKDLFIAIGDWNTELSNTKNPGSEVLRSLEKKVTFWLDSSLAEIGHTNESGSFAPRKLQLQLDYIAFSRHFKIRSAGIYHPKEGRRELGCLEKKEGRDIRSYFDRKQGRTCYATFSKDYLELKEASDHFPIWVNLGLID